MKAFKITFFMEERINREKSGNEIKKKITLFRDNAETAIKDARQIFERRKIEMEVDGDEKAYTFSYHNIELAYVDFIGEDGQED